MEFGNITVSDILLTAFSGCAVIFFSWLFRKKILPSSCFPNKKSNPSKVQQVDNIVHGDVAGQNIIKGDFDESVEVRQQNKDIEQRQNMVKGDLAGGNIVKKG